MKRLLIPILTVAAAAAVMPLSAHHSFAVYDMTQNFEFTGVVETVKLRNPHIALTLIHTKDDGGKEVIHFIEGAPANMLARMGLKPAMVAPGQTITAIGSPRRDDPTAFFLKAIILEDGTKFQVVQ
jgi:hypothetical protein